MRFFYGLFLIVIFLFPHPGNAQTPVNLFNQTDLTGWYAYHSKTGKHADASELFQVDQQMIRLSGPEAGYLMSEKSFTEFRLEAEFRWNTDSSFVRKNNSKNSGLMYLVPPTAVDTLWPKGIQFQIKEGATGDFILLQNVTLKVKNEVNEPGKSDVIKRMADAENPAGEWNSVTIIVKDGKITQQLNGKLVNEGTNPSVSAGRLLLQYEGFPIDFRKIRITEFN